MGSACARLTGSVQKPNTIQEQAETQNHQPNLSKPQNAQVKNGGGGGNHGGLTLIHAQEAIKKNDPELAERVLEELDPMISLWRPEDHYTCLHCAAKYNSFEALEVFLEFLVDTYSDAEIGDFIQVTDSDGNTAAMVAAMNDSVDCVYLFAAYEFIEFSIKNNNGENMEDICRNYSHDSLTILQEYRGDNLGVENQREKKKKKKNQNASMESNHHGHQFSDLETQNMQISQITTKMQTKKKAKKKQTVISNQSFKIFDIIDKCQSQGITFDDKEFSRSVESICQDTGHEQYDKFYHAVWKRLHEVFECDPSEVKLFDKVRPDDICQGILGVCYYLSSLSTLAEFPERLKSIYINKEANPAGAYSMLYYIQGIPKEIIVDDYFPCYPDRGTPMFSRPKGKELWVLLGEKSWAKIFGNYEFTEGGQMDEAFEYLLGSPSGRFISEDQTADEIWQLILRADQQKHLICAGTRGDISEEQGLCAGHAYSILSAHKAGQYRIFKLRNPWGSFEWKGDFSDNSPLWTEPLKQQIGYTNADDGTFCMTVEDFKKYFEFYSIGYHEDGWEYSYAEVDGHPKHANYFKVQVNQPCQAYFRIHQRDKRHLSREERKEFEYSPCDLWVAREEENGNLMPLVKEKDDLDSRSYWGSRTVFPNKDKKLILDKPGTYIIRTKVKWRHGNNDKYVVSAYSNVKLDLEPVNYAEFLPSIFKGLGSISDKKQEITPECKLDTQFYSHMMYIYAENGGDSTWTIDISFESLDNLRLGKHNQVGENQLQLVAGPRSSTVAYLKKINITGSASYKWEVKQQIQ